MPYIQVTVVITAAFSNIHIHINIASEKLKHILLFMFHL